MRTNKTTHDQRSSKGGRKHRQSGPVKAISTVVILAAAAVSALTAVKSNVPVEQRQEQTVTKSAVSAEDIPAYAGEPYVTVNNNIPDFSAYTETASFESYSELDALGRCGEAVACIGTDIMPTEERGEIGHIRPSGWQTVKYSGLVDGNYLYNRCHLIAYQLTGENDNEKNLITGTRYMNTEGMLPFENEVAAYINETGNHVFYRVTPVFEGNNLVAGGVFMEAESVEDNGAGVRFYVYCYNVQPGISIDYATGNSQAE